MVPVRLGDLGCTGVGVDGEGAGDACFLSPLGDEIDADGEGVGAAGGAWVGWIGGESEGLIAIEVAIEVRVGVERVGVCEALGVVIEAVVIRVAKGVGDFDVIDGHSAAVEVFAEREPRVGHVIRGLEGERVEDVASGIAEAVLEGVAIVIGNIGDGGEEEGGVGIGGGGLAVKEAELELAAGGPRLMEIGRFDFDRDPGVLGDGAGELLIDGVVKISLQVDEISGEIVGVATFQLGPGWSDAVPRPEIGDLSGIDGGEERDGIGVLSDAIFLGLDGDGLGAAGGGEGWGPAEDSGIRINGGAGGWIDEAVGD